MFCKQFLIDLTNEDEEHLRLLSFRLDFSQFYRSSFGPSLDQSLTYLARQNSSAVQMKQQQLIFDWILLFF